MADNSESGKMQTPQGPGFSSLRVLLMVGVVGAVVGGGYFFWTETQGSRPKATFTGVVTYQGKPVTVGSVMTEVIGDPLDFSIGFLDAEGRFSLETDGKAGASVGRHRVRISSMAPGIPPRPLVPPQYLESATTPLEIEVTTDPKSNVVTFELEGTIPEPAGAGGPPAGAQGAPGPPVPAEGAPSATPGDELTAPADSQAPRAAEAASSPQSETSAEPATSTESEKTPETPQY